MSDYILVKVKCSNLEEFICFLFSNNIYYRDLTIKEDYVCLYISSKHFDLLSRKYDSSIIHYCGTKRIINFIRENFIILSSFFFSLIIIYVLSHIIFSIEINSSDEMVKNIINDYLLEENIEVYKFFPSSKRINNLKERILSNNKDLIDFIEFRKDGVKYIIDVNIKTNKEKEDTLEYNDIVAKRDGLIKYLYVRGGVKVKEVNEIVHKGDTIISGRLYKNDKFISYESARGKVYAEVWYTVKTSVPYKHTQYISSGKSINHIYISFLCKKFTLIGKYETNESFNSEEVLVDKPLFNFKVIKETKELFEYRDVTLTKDEAFNEALNRSNRSINNRLNVDEYIIDKKVLKKSALSSKIELEVFYRVYESIGLVNNIDTLEGE